MKEHASPLQQRFVISNAWRSIGHSTNLEEHWDAPPSVYWPAHNACRLSRREEGTGGHHAPLTSRSPKRSTCEGSSSAQTAASSRKTSHLIMKGKYILLYSLRKVTRSPHRHKSLGERQPLNRLGEAMYRRRQLASTFKNNLSKREDHPSY